MLRFSEIGDSRGICAKINRGGAACRVSGMNKGVFCSSGRRSLNKGGIPV